MKTYRLFSQAKQKARKLTIFVLSASFTTSIHNYPHVCSVSVTAVIRGVFLEKSVLGINGMVANLARGELTRGNVFFHVPFRARERGLGGQARPSRPAPARSFSTPWLNLVLTHGLLSFLPFSTTAPIRTVNRHHPYIIKGQSRVDRVTRLRTDGVHRQDSAGTRPVVLKVVRVTSAA